MSYQEFPELPEFAHAQWGDNGKIANLTPDRPVWSATFEPPAIGTVVRCNFNRIGLCTVLGYFVEDGWLGLMCRPHDPPDWYIKQNGKKTPCHLFGAECLLLPDPGAS